ncbi:hypothetical protein QN277_006824 [Acacia crassicarpa]|uniref:Exonuclease domain-containing protein n=1 Tax=Acacia crassicarpa TaxID=499986 RepID=A0AAE1IUK7_9FABA|nr:hypothetical protein QN277_006824 [Acacia crassicarpa]
MDQTEDGSEIVFFDVETTIPSPTRPGQRYAILEFGAILVCPKKLTELRNYSTLVRPANPSLISPASIRCNGITSDDVASAPTFADIADTVYELLHERVWAGYNILRFDCVRIREAFTEINRPPPEPKGTIDSLPLLTQTFGRRAGNMKMASLATYFGLGQQTHRSLDDVRMNLEVLKHCATVLFLESSLPNILTVNSVVSPNATRRSRSSGKSLPDLKVKPMLLFPTTESKHFDLQSTLPNVLTVNSVVSPNATPTSRSGAKSLPDLKVKPMLLFPTTESKHFDLCHLRGELNRSVMVHEKPIIPETPHKSSSSSAAVSSNSEVVLNPDEILMSCLAASLLPLYRDSQRIQLLHKGVPFQLCCTHLKIRFGINGRFLDSAGRPKLNFVVDLDPSQTLFKVLEDCDRKAQRLSLESGSSSEWRPVIIRNDGFFNYYTLRLQIPTAESGNNAAIYATEIYRRESASTMKRLVFDKFDVAELASLSKPGSFVDAVFSFDSYDYQQNAGIRLIAKRLILLSN